MGNAWRDSIALRRTVSALVLVVAAVLLSLAARIPQPVALPNDEVNKRAVIPFGDALRITKPMLEQGGTVLSYPGEPNETAEVWIDHATLTGATQQLLGSTVGSGASSVVYAETQNAKGTAGQHCRTAVVVRRAPGSAAPAMVELMQRDPGTGDQQFRQVLLRAPGTAMQVEVHTDSDTTGPEGLTLCPSTLKVGGVSVDVPAGPVYLAVPDDWINLRIESTDPSHPAWRNDAKTLDGVSLGDDGLKAGGAEIDSQAKKVPLLHVQPHRGTDAVTLHDLKIAARQMTVEVGAEGETANATADGKPFPVLNLPDVIGKNLVLSGLAGGMVAALLAWAKTMWFPAKKGRNKGSVGGRCLL